MLNVYVIGCGGIGGYLIERLPMAISSLTLDVLESQGVNVSRYLENAGNVALPCIVDRLVLIDKDVFDARNALRQGAGAGSKLVQRMLSVKRAISEMKEAADMTAEALSVLLKLHEDPACEALRKAVGVLEDDRHLTAEMFSRLNDEILRVSFLQKMQLVGYNECINPENMDEIIPLSPPINQHNQEAYDMLCRGWNGIDGRKLLERLNSTVVFMCVDNVQTRYEVSKHMEKFRNCLLLNGGNSRTTGHATVYERQNGIELDPPLYKVYTDIRPGVDKRPDQEECTRVAAKHDQISVTNEDVANKMKARFLSWVRYGLTVETRGGRKIRNNDVLIDIEQPSATPVYHPVTAKS